ncbi:MAG: DNA repair protein RecN [Pseudomonadota bacterium]
MLAALSIRDVVLIDRLDLDFSSGLCVLTGETGAGKSILLDSLGLALGARAEARLVRGGATQAVVSAAFDLPADHPARALLADSGLEADDDLVILRRQLGADGRSRGFVNDQPVAVALLRRLGELLVEWQGQFDQRGLLDASQHRALLDAFARLAGQDAAVAQAWQAWREAEAAHAEAETRLSETRRDEELLRHAATELEALDPKPGEADTLAEQRSLLVNREQLADALNGALASLSGEGAQAGAGPALSQALSALERMAPRAGQRLAPAIAALQRAASETEEALAQVYALSADLEGEADQLEAVEERYFALKDLARKHDVEVDQLAELLAKIQERVAQIDQGSDGLAELAQAVVDARAAYLAAGETQRAKRQTAARRLDKAVKAELAPLKLEKARFQTRLTPLAESDLGPGGLDRIAFEIATTPKAAPGPLAKIASGGELSRILLALKVVLSDLKPEKALVFDEVDNGIGGATADAVGARLARLAAARQVLVVTHSPQVAARASHHWRVRKEARGKTLATRVEQVTAEARREEIARMLSGAEVTAEARAAAERLMGAA